ncbi:MAG: methyltransferase [Rhodospirillales bacterium]|nr:methyltransferase [Rhodospirillales bacterium]
MVSIEPSARQFSPLIPGAERLEDCIDGSFASITMVAHQGVLERRYALAHALRALGPDGRLTALAPNARGGMRIAKELAGFGCAVDQVSRRHHRICHTVRPAETIGLEDAIAAGGSQIPPALALWSQPGIFSWDRPDPGSLALIRHLPSLAGAGADFGCGVGLLARAILESPAVVRLSLLDIDRRAIDAARRNIADERACFVWRDVRTDVAETRGLDFVVMNPPFHDGGIEDRALGEAFIGRAAAALKPGGICWLVANRHLPYEAHLKTIFAIVRQVEQSDGYKIYEARR